jgi:T5SS/PEP-CTERM-associated repeat protein
MGASSSWYHDEQILLDEFRDGGLSGGPAPVLTGYADLRRLRQGGQGVVYSATQLSTKRRVAIKVLPQEAWAAQRHRQRFEREIDLLAAVQHPGLIRLYDCGLTDQGQPYYVMEYIDGLALDQYVRRRAGTRVDRDPEGGHALDVRYDTAESDQHAEHDDADWPVRAALELFLQVCDAVAAAHQRGMIHRDLKPSNILVDKDGKPHVLDFGLGKRLDTGGIGSSAPAVSVTGEFMGSLPWASPEQTDGDPNEVDARTDVYALGVLLYQVLTGRFPYTVTGGLSQVVDQIKHAEPRRPGALRRDVDHEVDTIVLKCLAKEPERRYADAGDVARDIRLYLAGEPIEARADSTIYRLRKRFHRHGMTVGLAAALLVVAVVALASTLSASRGGRTAGLGLSPRSGARPAIANSVDRIGETNRGETYFANALRGIPEYSSFPANLAIGHGDGPGGHSVGSDESVEVNGMLYVGYSADGRLEIADGGMVSNQDADVAELPGSTGHVEVTGSQSRWITKQTLGVGMQGVGTLELRNGATVSSIAGRIGMKPTGAGTATIAGPGSTWEYGVDLDCGFAGTGNLVIRSGGAAHGLYGHVAAQPGSIGEVSIVNPGSLWTNRASLYIGGDAGISGGRGHVLLEDGGALHVHHTLEIWGAGRVDVAGGVLCADTVVHTAGGVLELTAGRVYVNSFHGDIRNEGGVLGAAQSPGRIEVTGDYAQYGGALELRLHGHAADQHDTLVVFGSAELGGKLEIILAAGFAPAYEDRLPIISAGELIGVFEGGDGRLAINGGGYCIATYSATEAVLTGFEGPFHSDRDWIDPTPDGPLPRPELPAGPFPRRLSQNTTSEHDLIFLGPPDNIGMGIAGQIVEYDFGDLCVVDGQGPDFTIYECDAGTPEHGNYDVLVSQDGVNFMSVKAGWSKMVRIPGDEAHGSALHAQSIDIGYSGFSFARFIRIDGVGDGPVHGSDGFDLDAIGAIHLARPQPSP